MQSVVVDVLPDPVVFARVEKKVDGPKRLSAAVNSGPRAGDSGGSGMGYACLYHYDYMSEKSKGRGEDKYPRSFSGG